MWSPDDVLVETEKGNFKILSILSKNEYGEYRVVAETLMDANEKVLYQVSEENHKDLAFCLSAVQAELYMLNRKKGLLS